MISQNDELNRIHESLSTLLVTQTRLTVEFEDVLQSLTEILRSTDTPPVTSFSRKSQARGPHVNHRKMEISWKGRSCFLSNSVLLRLAGRLAQTPNILVSHTTLLDEVWGSIRSQSTIRGAAKRLRDRLIAAGMTDLAEAIDGSVHGHYRLNLVREKAED